MERTTRRPAEDEFNEFYKGYIDLVPRGEIVAVLRSTLDDSLAQLAGIPAEKLDYRYEEGKWSVREVIGHVIDTEWVFSYRALRFARGDQTPLPGMDQDLFMAGANFESRSLRSLVEELRHLRAANLRLFDSFDDEILDRSGDASGYRVTVRALLYVIAGHPLHHWAVLKEKYLQA